MPGKYSMPELSLRPSSYFILTQSLIKSSGLSHRIEEEVPDRHILVTSPSVTWKKLQEVGGPASVALPSLTLPLLQLIAAFVFLSPVVKFPPVCSANAAFKKGN